MTLNDENKCSVPATEQECPEDMYPDPNDDEKCIYTPEDIDCGLGTLDPATKRCKFVSTPECTVGKPVNGKCVSNPVCKTEGAKYNPHSGACHLREPPVCPENSRLIGTDCISDDPSKCLAPSKLSLDKKRCVYEDKPKCPENARYDADLQLCVFDNKPKCADGTGDLDGADCVSPSRPACLNPDTEFDPATGACVGKKRPECETGFYIPPGGTKCISNKGPVCEGDDFRLEGDRCISDKEPECPPDSKWIHVKKACVSDKGPCAEGTPDSNGNCVNPEPPKCRTPGTHFEPGFGCLADEKPKCPIPNTQLNEETGECEADTGPSCDEGLELRGNLCVSQKKPHCPDHTEPKDGKCIAKAKPVCDRSDLTFNEVRKACVGGDPRCPDGTALDRDMSKCITASSRTCFVMLACPDVHDDTSPPSIEG
ncbi:hypothetical protein B0T18DRAFT_414298 [Schizothecium vesticola]|uniref:Cell wall cysteine-rich protein n=1 Tax=Schizothecium vesticola TaxID=314040 RepID=A0AA40K233_9PEZI|nr:hypothetical protein B0T18DRAFT_414298 [Schizothecium vesticola]